MKFKNIYFINGSAYAGKSTMVKELAKKYDGIACEENYHDSISEDLDSVRFPCLTYTRDLVDWGEFVRRTPDEYSAWIDGCNRECAVIELKILEELSKQDKKIFVDTNIPIDMLWDISDKTHVLIMLADPEISVHRFFDRPDKEKQFIYQLLMKEENPDQALNNYRECLRKLNSQENYNNFLESGFHVILSDDSRTIEETLLLTEKMFGLI